MNEYNYIIIIIFKKNIFDKQKKNLKYMYVMKNNTCHFIHHLKNL